MSHVRLRRLVRPVNLCVSRHHVVFHAARVRVGRRRPGIPHHARGHTSVGVAVEGAHGRVEHALRRRRGDRGSERQRWKRFKRHSTIDSGGSEQAGRGARATRTSRRRRAQQRCPVRPRESTFFQRREGRAIAAHLRRHVRRPVAVRRRRRGRPVITHVMPLALLSRVERSARVDLLERMTPLWFGKPKKQKYLIAFCDAPPAEF